MLKEGDKAPVFNLVDDEGNKVTLKDFKGKNVILYFYPKDDTPGCTKEACEFRDQQKIFNKKDTAILGVSADSIESHGKFKKKYRLTFPLLSDPDRETIKAYGVWKKKSLYGREFMGIERSTFVINGNGKIQKIFRKVKVDGHIEKVLESVNSN